MKQHYYFFAYILFSLDMAIHGMLVNSAARTVHGKHHMCQRIQKRNCSVVRPIDDAFLNTIDSLCALENMLKDDYVSAQAILLNKYVADKKAFRSLNKACIQYMNNYGLREAHPACKRNPNLPPKLVTNLDAYAQSTDIHPKALSYDMRKSKSGNQITAYSPRLAFTIKPSRPEDKQKQRNDEPLFMPINNWRIAVPACLTFSPEWLNDLYTNKRPQHAMEWEKQHEFWHLKQHHGLFIDLLYDAHTVIHDGSNWYINSQENTIQQYANTLKIPFSQTPEFENLVRARERIADIGPLLMNKDFAKNTYTLLCTTKRKNGELYLTQDELKKITQKILICWEKESSDTRPMPILYE